MTSFTTTIQEDPDDPESLIIEFPEELLAELDWKPGDILTWEIKDDNTVVISKK